MRKLSLLLLSLVAAGMAQASPPAGPWCSVSQADAAASPATVSLLHRLQPLLASVPQPPSRVHTEGTLPHQGIRDESIEAEKQLPIMRDAALAWRAGGGDDYLAPAKRYLNAWVQVYQPDFNPIDETVFDAMIDTYAIVQPQLAAADRDTARAFFKRWAQGYTARSRQAKATGQQRGSWTNNWQSHRVKLVTMMAVALDDQELFDGARQLFQYQLADNIKADGEVIDFAERDALHYVLYDLAPLSQAALAARTRGEDWYRFKSGNGASLETALRWLQPYASGARPHEEFVHSKVAFDAQRAAAGVKGYSGAFEPKSAANLYWLAAELDPSYAALAASLGASPPFAALCGQ